MKCWIAPIVEGHGEVEAVPVLLRKVCPSARIARPVRFPKSRLITQEGLSRAARIAAANAESGQPGLVLLVIDADEDCAKELGPTLLKWLGDAAPGIECFVAIVVREFETWIVGGQAECDLAEVEKAGGLIERIRKLNAGRYMKTVDQPKLASRIDTELLRQRSRSFRRLVDRLRRLAAEVDSRDWSDNMPA